MIAAGCGFQLLVPLKQISRWPTLLLDGKRINPYDLQLHEVCLLHVIEVIAPDLCKDIGPTQVGGLMGYTYLGVQRDICNERGQ